MKDGHVLLRTNTLVLMGVAGSGKSSVKDLLLNNPPKEERNSTPCRDRILHVRPVTNQLVSSTGNKWEEVSQQDMVLLLAEAIEHLPRSSIAKLTSDLQSRLKQISTDRVLPGSVAPTLSTLTSQPSISPVQRAISTVTDQVIEAMASKTQASTKPKKGKELFGSTTMRITDNGGQPQFQDIASLFIRHASAGLFVMRLTDDFNDYPFDDLYKDGELVGTPSPSHLSHGETIMSLLRSFLSYRQDQRFIFIGTFLDKIKNFRASRVRQKNKRLFEMLPPELKNEVVYSSPGLDKIIFALNACSRDAATQAVAEEIRKAVEESTSFDIEVPLWWFIIEISLQNLSSFLGRGVLRKCECTELAQHLGFHSDALEAALVYFDEMCIVHYYPKILPDVVFVDPQVPLDKVSELTQYAISLREAKERKGIAQATSAISAKWRKFRDQGILTTDMLESKEFEKHFEKDLFTPSDMIAIMRELLVIAPLIAPSVSEADLPLSELEFFMPTLLRSVPPAELEKHRVFNPSADPLLIRFGSGCIRCGVFCCLIVFLMKACGWHVCLSSGETIFLARNCIKFQLPNDPVSITLIDSFYFIEVHINAAPRICQMVCPRVRKSLVEGVNAASSALHYNNDKPLTSFFCPHKRSILRTRINHHFAQIFEDTLSWRCSINGDLTGALKPVHKVWLAEDEPMHVTYGECVLCVTDINMTCRCCITFFIEHLLIS